MARRITAMRYARAAFEIAIEKNELEVWQSDFKTLASLTDDAEIMAYLDSPKTRFEEKAKLLGKQADGLNPLALNLAYMLMSKGDLSAMGEVAVEFERLLQAKRGIEQAEVTTAVSLNDAEKEKLKERLAAMVGKKIELKTKVDPSLISGMIARIGDKLIDGSTASGLAALNRQLSEGGL